MDPTPPKRGRPKLFLIKEMVEERTGYGEGHGGAIVEGGEFPKMVEERRLLKYPRVNSCRILHGKFCESVLLQMNIMEIPMLGEQVAQPQLPQELPNQPPIALAHNQPPTTPVDNQPPAQIPQELPNQLPIALAQNQSPMTPANNQPPAQIQAPVDPVPIQLEAPPSEAPAPSKPVVPWDKNYLQQYTQKEGLPLPLYVTVSNGSLHSPRFTSEVVVNGVSYTSCGDFSTRKAAEMDIARIGLQGVQHQVEKCSIGQEELTLCKAILKEYADKIHAEKPNYKTEKGDGLGFTSFLTFNGKQYVGDKGRNKKESQHLAARAVILSILDSDSRDVISMIIKSKRKMICPAKGKFNCPQNAQNVGKPAGIQTMSNVGISASKEIAPVVGNDDMVSTGMKEPCTGNSSFDLAEPVSLIKASARPNFVVLIGGSTSSKKRKRKTKKVENNAGFDAQF